MPGFAATLPRRSRERGAKAYLRRERPISKPSSNVESHPKDCSAGNQKTSQKYGTNEGDKTRQEKTCRESKRQRRENMIHFGTWLTVRNKLTSEKKKLNDVENVELESLSENGSTRLKWIVFNECTTFEWAAAMKE